MHQVPAAPPAVLPRRVLRGPIGVAMAVVVAVTAIACEAPPHAAAAETYVVDGFDRTVASGWGSAPTGGAYTLDGSGSVAGGVGTLSGIAPGSADQAMLLSTSAAEPVVDAVLSVPVLPGGSGLYASVVMRARSTGESYRGRARIAADGRVLLSLSRVSGGTETLLGAEVASGVTVAAGTKVHLRARTTGTSPVTVSASAWLEGATAPSGWQASASDSSTSRLTTAGALGVSAYLSGSATTAASLRVHDLGATGTAPAPTSTTTPTSTPTSTPTGSTTSSAGGTLGTTSYAVPSGAFFVSPSGSDTGSGSQSSPWRHVQKAVDAAPSGSTIVLRGGTYHEQVKVPAARRLTLQAYPGETPWLDGATTVTGWVASGTTWVKTGWTASFPSNAGLRAGTNDTSFIDPAYPMAAHPDQVWVDGRKLQQVSAQSKVVAGTFYVDYGADRLYIGDNPSGHTVAASDLAGGLFVESDGSRVLGIGVRRFATPASDLGTLKIDGVGVTVENVVVSDNANIGVSVSATKATVNRVTTTGNGMLGMAAVYADGLVVSRVLARDNNAEHYNMTPVSGGVKITRTRGITVRDSQISANRGPGLWFDESSYDAKVYRNLLTDNVKHGMAYEISSKAAIVDNVLTGNGGTGMKINDATDVRIWNNTLGGNGKNIDLVQDSRRASDLSWPGHDPRQQLPDPTVTWLLSNVDLMNNRVIRPTGTTGTLVRDYSQERSADQMDVDVDGNQFDPFSSGSMLTWGLTKSTLGQYRASSPYESATGQGPGNGDTSTDTKPRGLPSDLAALVGVPAGTAKVGDF